jgi:hypothetical protein
MQRLKTLKSVALPSTVLRYKFSGFQGLECLHYCHIGCDTVYSCSLIPLSGESCSLHIHGRSYRIQYHSALTPWHNFYPNNVYPEDRDWIFRRNIIIHLQDYTVLQYRRSWCFYLLHFNLHRHNLIFNIVFKLFSHLLLALPSNHFSSHMATSISFAICIFLSQYKHLTHTSSGFNEQYFPSICRRLSGGGRINTEFN